MTNPAETFSFPPPQPDQLDSIEPTLSPPNFVNFKCYVHPPQLDILNPYLNGNADMQDIVLRGQLNGRNIEFTDGCNNASDEINTRQAFGEIYSKNPDVASALAEAGAAGVHGTRSVALAGVLERGSLQSARLLKERGVLVTTGEHINQGEAGQGSISFSLIGAVDRALVYSGIYSEELSTEDAIARKQAAIATATSPMEDDQMVYERLEKAKEAAIKAETNAIEMLREHPESLFSQLTLDDFPVLFVVTKDFIERTTPDTPTRRLRGHTSSNYSEFRPYPEEIPLENMMLAVPSDKLTKVQHLLQQYDHPNVQVLPFEDLIPDSYLRMHAREQVA